MGILHGLFHGHTSEDRNSETGSDSEYYNSWDAEYAGASYRRNSDGHPIPAQTVASPFYQVNPARWNGADVEPIPVTPVRKQNWPEMQVQLRNGWGTTNFGRKISYDGYLRLLTDSASKNRHYLIPHPSGLGPHAQRPGPAPANVSQMIANGAGSQPTNPGAPGQMASGVDLSGRSYYG